MSVPNLPRIVGLALGIVLVSVASVSVGDPVLRTGLVWLGFAPTLWGLYGLWMQKALLEAASLAAAESAPTASSTASPAKPASQSPAANAAPEGLAPVSKPAPPAAAGKRTPAEAAQGPAFTGERPAPSRPDQRQYLALRRLTEQYLKEVRRMNLIAVWGREGTIGRQQALDEIRQIETRMRNLTERMKFAAGKLED